ncbi:MAG: trigger factor [Bellilinea sp.]
MKLEVQPRDDHQVNVTAEFEHSILEDFKRRAARKISRQTRIPGFRPGKAPYEFVRRVVGDEALTEQAIEELIDEYYPKILEEAKIKPGAAGNLEKVVSLDPPTFSFLVPLEPEVDLGNYTEIRLDYQVETVEENEVEEFLKRLQTNYSTAEPVDRPAQSGDLVYLKFFGRLIKPAEGEDEFVFPERPAQFILDSDIMENRKFPFPGFSEKLNGLKENESLTLTHTFAQDHEDESLRGKEVEFNLTVQSIKALTLPELNDEFAQNMGQFESLEKLKDAIREQIAHNKQESADNAFYAQLFEKLIGMATIKYPPQVLEHEVEHLLEDFQADLSKQGLEMEAYFKVVNKDRESFVKDEIEPAARRRLERSLVMEKFAALEEIKMDENTYHQAVQDTIRDVQSFPQQKKPSKVELGKVTQDVLMLNINRKFNQMVLDRMKALATGQADKAEVVQPAESQSEDTQPEPASTPAADEPSS